VRSGRHEEEANKDRPLMAHFLSGARGADVAKVHSLNEICGLRVSLETYIVPKNPLQYKRY
jgi:hypothetical protein